jgi:flagellar biosynthesis/type III secretory pathway protein FliH
MGLRALTVFTPSGITVDAADEIAAAEARGHEAGIAEGRAELAAAVADERERAAIALAAERQAWTVAEADRLATALEGGLAALRESIAASLARVVAPLLLDARRAELLDGLAADLRSLSAQGEAPILRVSGPADLLGALRERLSSYPADVAYESTSEGDIRVEAGDTVFQTQLQPWADRLAGLLG